MCRQKTPVICRSTHKMRRENVLSQPRRPHCQPEEVVYPGYVDVSNDGCEQRRVPDINPGIVPEPAVSSEIMLGRRGGRGGREIEYEGGRGLGLG